MSSFEEFKTTELPKLQKWFSHVRECRLKEIDDEFAKRLTQQQHDFSTQLAKLDQRETALLPSIEKIQHRLSQLDAEESKAENAKERLEFYKKQYQESDKKRKEKEAQLAQLQQSVVNGNEVQLRAKLASLQTLHTHLTTESHDKDVVLAELTKSVATMAFEISILVPKLSTKLKSHYKNQTVLNEFKTLVSEFI
ncbi:hypothetical protein GEMRC1_002679 [Eukaryota sp. GEM-RC1]